MYIIPRHLAIALKKRKYESIIDSKGLTLEAQKLNIEIKLLEKMLT